MSPGGPYPRTAFQAPGDSPPLPAMGGAPGEKRSSAFPAARWALARRFSKQAAPQKGKLRQAGAPTQGKGPARCSGPCHKPHATGISDDQSCSAGLPRASFKCFLPPSFLLAGHRRADPSGVCGPAGQGPRRRRAEGGATWGASGEDRQRSIGSKTRGVGNLPHHPRRQPGQRGRLWAHRFLAPPAGAEPISRRTGKAFSSKGFRGNRVEGPRELVHVALHGPRRRARNPTSIQAGRPAPTTTAEIVS